MSYPPSVTEISRYQDYRVAVEQAYIALANPEMDVKKNPFDKEENPQRHGTYNAILTHGAVACYHLYHLNERTLEQHIRDTIKNEDQIKEFSRRARGDQKIVLGSDTHLDAINDYKKDRPDLKRGQLNNEFLKTHISSKLKLAHALYDQYELEWLRPFIVSWSNPNNDVLEAHTQNTAIYVDHMLGFLSNFKPFPSKDNGQKLGLALRARSPEPAAETEKLLAAFRNKFKRLQP